jgi:hypothetical protein
MAFSQAGAETHEELVSRYMIMSEKGQSATNLLTSLGLDLSEPVKQKLGAFISWSRHEMVHIISSSLDDDTLRKLIAFHESPLGQKISEKVSSMKPDMELIDAYYSEISGRADASPRMELIQRFDSNTGYSEMLTDVGMKEVKFSGMSMDITLNRNGQKVDGSVPLGSFMNEQRDAMIPKMKLAMQKLLLYMFKELSDEELKAYVAFNETDAGRQSMAVKCKTLTNGIRLFKEFCRKNPDVMGNVMAAFLKKASKDMGSGSKMSVEQPDAGSKQRLANALERLKTFVVRARGEQPLHDVLPPQDRRKPSIRLFHTPDFPEGLKNTHSDQIISVRVLVDEHGVPMRSDVVKREPEDSLLCDESAIDAAMHSTYYPALDKAKPIRAWLTVKLIFRDNE